MARGRPVETLAAYRRDLTLYAAWLASRGTTWCWTPPPNHLNAYFAARHAATRATSANRRLTVFTLLPLGAARAAHHADPTLKLQSARQPRVPKTLARRRWRLLAAPDGTHRWACATAPCWS